MRLVKRYNILIGDLVRIQRLQLVRLQLVLALFPGHENEPSMPVGESRRNFHPHEILISRPQIKVDPRLFVVGRKGVLPCVHVGGEITAIPPR
jgi:hypothetical protein